MSRKDYNAVAVLIREQIPGSYFQSIEDGDDWETLVEMLDSEDYGRLMAARNIADGMADLFAADNPSFDRDRFMAACGVSDA